MSGSAPNWMPPAEREASAACAEPIRVAPHALAEIALFREVFVGDLARISGALHGGVFPPNTLLMSAAQPGGVVYFVVSGTVKIYVEGVDGLPITLALAGAGEVLGEMSAVDHLGRSASVMTREETTLYWMDQTTFQECLRTIPRLSTNLTRLLSRRLRLANAQIQALAALDVYGRVARQLVAFAREYGEPRSNGDLVIPFRLTQSDLASLVGASRVRVNQVLVAYKRRQYISASSTHRITVHNLPALTARCR